MKASKGEEKIIQLLKKSGYKFEREKRFKDLRHGLLRFDFYVMGGPSKFCIIEVNGMQHYKQVGKFHRSRAEFVAAQERDRRKISYCLSHIEYRFIAYLIGNSMDLHARPTYFSRSLGLMIGGKTTRTTRIFSSMKNLTSRCRI